VELDDTEASSRRLHRRRQLKFLLAGVGVFEMVSLGLVWATAPGHDEPGGPGDWTMGYLCLGVLIGLFVTVLALRGHVGTIATDVEDPAARRE
jgi:hypothetical protein